MLSPVVFAIFVVCNSNLLLCASIPSLTKDFQLDVYKCTQYVNRQISNNKHQGFVVFGKCVWRKAAEVNG